MIVGGLYHLLFIYGKFHRTAPCTDFFHDALTHLFAFFSLKVTVLSAEKKVSDSDQSDRTSKIFNQLPFVRHSLWFVRWSTQDSVHLSAVVWFSGSGSMVQ